MTRYAKVIAGGTSVIPADLHRECDIVDGDAVPVERTAIGRHGPEPALRSIRDKTKGYTVGQFLAERRGDWVEWGRSSISRFVVFAASIAEALAKVIDCGVDEAEAAAAVRQVPLERFAFDVADAHRAAALGAVTRACGVSMADRACLALAQALDLPVPTAGRQ